MDWMLPTQNPVAIMAIAILVFLLAPQVSARLRLPPLIGLILAGAILGPFGTGVLERDVTIELLGTAGLLYLMFVAGLELDLRGFSRYRTRSVTFGSISFVIPLVLSLLVMPRFGFSLEASLLIGAIVGSHTLLAYPILGRLGITKNAAATTVMGGTLLTDTLSLTVLAVIDAAAGGDGGALQWLRLFGFLGLYVFAVVWGLPKLGRWFFRTADAETGERFLFLLGAMFTSAFLAELAGAQPIIGAFLAGLSLNRLVPEKSTMMSRVSFVGRMIFIPFFLFSVGMLVDFRVLASSTEVLVVAGLLVALVVVGKGGAALLGQRIFGFTRAEGFMMAGLSIPQAAATLAVTFVGLEIGLLDAGVVNAVIVLILVSTLLGSLLVERAGRSVALATESEAPNLNIAPPRVLVPLANPANSESLLDIAFMLRDPGTHEPVFPLTVVPEDDHTQARVAGAERMLAHAVVYAADAEVPLHPLTRVAQNPAMGILRAATERNVTDIVIGWHARQPNSWRVFGRIIDQTVEQSEQNVFVCRLRTPVNTAKRVVMILPPYIDYNPGFYGAIRHVKTLVGQIGAKLSILAVQGDTDRLRQRIDEVQPEAEAEYAGITGWGALRSALDAAIDANDLLVVISARRGTLAHSPELERLPGELAQEPTSFIVVFPSELEIGSDVGVPDLLQESHVVCDMTSRTYGDAVQELLAQEELPRTVNRERLEEMLVNDEVGFAAEVLPGILILHGRVPNLPRPMLFLGIAREGIAHRSASGDVHVITLVLSPSDVPPPEHLARLSEVTQQLRHGGPVEDLVACASFGEVRAWFERRQA